MMLSHMGKKLQAVTLMCAQNLFLQNVEKLYQRYAF